MKRNVTRQTATWLQQADHMPIIFRSYFGSQQADLRPIICRSYFGSQQADLIPILFRVTAGRSYFRTRRNACVTAGKTTMAAGNINYGCFEMLSWPHGTSNNIVNICFWLLETYRKCSYVTEEYMRAGTQRLAFEVKLYRVPIHEYISRTDPRIYCCDRTSRAAYAQSFALWQQATIEFTCHDHSIITCSRNIYVSCCSSRTSRSW